MAREIEPVTINLLEKIASNFVIDANQHWLWQKSKSVDGYGVFGIPGKGMFRAHRVMFAQVTGSIDSRLEIDHLCRIKNCINPKHMEQVTKAENIRRSYLYPRKSNSVRKQRALSEYCGKGHKFTVENTIIKKRSNTIKKTQRECRECAKINYKKYYAKLK